MRLLFILLATALFIGCESQPDTRKRVETSNPNYEVVLLFEVDGVKVYRFYDMNDRIYFVDSRGRMEWDVVRSDGENKTVDRYGVDTIGD